MDTNYSSQMAWIQFRMNQSGRTKPASEIGREVDPLLTFRYHLRAVDIEYPGAPHSMLVFLAEFRTVREFCKSDKSKRFLRQLRRWKGRTAIKRS